MDPAPTRPTDVDADGASLIQANSATRALNIIGDRWTLMILHQMFFRVRRFEDFQARIGLARSLLTDRLRRLEAAGVLRRERYQTRPPRDEYRLTEMGRDLYGAALMIIGWEKRWFYDAASPAHHLTHDGHAFIPQFRCAHCSQIVLARDVTSDDGPGAGLEPQQKPRAQRRSIVPGSSLTQGDPMLERAIAVIGDRWIAHVIASAFMGRRRFTDFQAALGAAPNILADRLGRLVDLGVLRRQLYQDRPARWEYRLTELGLDLFPLIAELVRWGDRWLAGPDGPPVIMRHKTCGMPLAGKITCDTCEQPVNLGNSSPPA
jgi:DNA-binding HxlR family transcriptional regulator